MRAVLKNIKKIVVCAAKQITQTNDTLYKLITNLKKKCKKTMGKIETIIEGIVLAPQKNCRYTPYYNHFFNGADTICLVKNMSIIPQILLDKYFESESDQKNIDGIVSRHGEIWKSFKNVVPQLRAAWLIFPMEIREIIHNVKAFYVT